LPGESGLRLFNEVWWFSASSTPVQNMPLSTLYCHFSNALKELAFQYDRPITIYCPLMWLDEDESNPHGVLLLLLIFLLLFFLKLFLSLSFFLVVPISH
jgi:hypothetical protein